MGIDFLFVLTMFLCMNPSKAWNAKLKAILFWPSENLYKQAVQCTGKTVDSSVLPLVATLTVPYF